MLKSAIEKLVGREDLSTDEAAAAMNEIMEGRGTPSQIAAFLIALRMKGETVDEITGCARVMREKVTRLNPKKRPLVDTCGTGGDASNTFNISTCSAFVVAGAGVGVAKHGNRGMSSACGSADVLQELGVQIETEPAIAEKCIDEVGLGFMYAPLYHGAMKHAIGPRREVGVRTIFNILGPLSNPAFAEAQILGVYDRSLVEPLAHVLRNLGVRHAFVVSGADGLDEITTAAVSIVAETNEDTVRVYEFDPGDVGVELCRREDLLGGDSAKNAAIIEAILKGEKGPCRDIVVLNAAFALVAADFAESVPEGIEAALRSIDSGAALSRLEHLREVSSA
jgi:anthranilate phosphoribosyltransferase